jgi:hypothetical protein
MKLSTARTIQRRSRIIKASLLFHEGDTEELVVVPQPPPPISSSPQSPIAMIVKPKPRRRHAMVPTHRLKRRALGKHHKVAPARSDPNLCESSDRSAALRGSLMSCDDCVGSSASSGRSAMGILEDRLKNASIHGSGARDVVMAAAKTKKKKKTSMVGKRRRSKPQRRHGMVIRSASPTPTPSRPLPAARLVSDTPGTDKEPSKAPF